MKSRTPQAFCLIARNENMEKYSVLMSLYQKENPAYLRLAIQSMLDQTIKPDEIVIVEDGPLTKELYAVMEEYTSGYPGVFKIVVNEKNLGLGTSLNRGLRCCRNDLVARMDTDDISKPQRCEAQLKRFAEKPELAIVGAWVDEFDQTPETILCTRKVPCDSDAIYAFAKRRSAFNHPAVMYRRSKVLENHGYSDLRRNQDVDLFGRMLYAGCKCENIGESLLWFRSNSALAKRRKSWENTKTYIETIRRFWQMGYADFKDFAIVAVAQTILFVMPVRMQQWVYKAFLRK